MRVALGASALALGALTLGACAANGSNGGFDGTDDDVTSTTEDGGATPPGAGRDAAAKSDPPLGSMDGGALEDGQVFTGSGDDGAAPSDGGSSASVGEVYGHSQSVLYKLEPFTKAVSIVGTFDCVQLNLTTCAGGCGDGMWDVALDKSGQMYGTVTVIDGTIVNGAYKLAGKLVKIDKATAHCTVIQSAATAYPNSLTFIPVGLLDSIREVLTGYNVADYVRVDTDTGAITKIGSLNPNATGSNWYSSGDIVSIIGGKTYLTAKPTDDLTYAGTDWILEIDPKTGQALKVIGDTTFPKLWGLGFWAGTAYGFSDTGQLAAIDLSTGKGTPIPLMNLPANLSFWGAGNTTAAPVDPAK